MNEEMTSAYSDKILVVDDTTANLQLLMDILTKQGYTVYPASDGELALMFVQSILPDLILLDVKMPGMDGFEVCRRLKADERTRSIPIIFVSILEDELDKVKGFQVGGVDYVTKPFKPEEVLARVRTHLHLRDLTLRLEKKVRERTEELTTVNQQLQQEIIERKQAEEEVLESRERLSRIVDTVPSAILTIDTTGHITFANTAAQEILYIKPEVAIGQLYADPSLWLAMTIDGKIIPEEERPFMRALHTGANVEDQQYVAEFPNGTRRTLSVNAAPMHGLSGEIIGVVESLTDITQVSILQHTIENQLSLLRQALVPPLPPMISGYKAAFIYRPAFPAESIGGDLYDVFNTESGKIGIMIGDVAGKGVEAAALAAAARSTLHSFTYDLSSTDAAMWHSNAVLESQETLMGEFITAFLAVIDPHTGSFTYSRAGHPPPAILRADGRVDFLEEGDIPIGLFSGQEYSPFKEYLNPRDKIVLYTDGITEARHHDELFWQDGVQRALSACVDCSPDEVAKVLLEEARKWAEGQLQDDIAILVIERSSEELSEEEMHIPPSSI